jgi:hypothetical protein
MFVSFSGALLCARGNQGSAARLDSFIKVLAAEALSSFCNGLCALSAGCI